MSPRYPTPLIVGAAMALGLVSSASAVETVIFSHSFDGPASGLNGVVPDVRPGTEVWSAQANLNADGTYTSATAGSSWLAYAFQNDQVYTLTATIDIPYASNSATSATLAFTTTPTNLGNVLTSATIGSHANLMVKRGGGWDFYPGPNNDTALVASGANNSLFTTTQDDFELKLVLTTSSTSNWTVAAFLGGNQVDLDTENEPSMAYTFLSTPALTGFGIGGATTSFTWESISLSVTAVPEPSTLSLLLGGTAGLLALTRRRRG